MGYTVIVEGRRPCIRCGIVKPISEFSECHYTTKQGKPSTRLDSRCKRCNATRHLRTTKRRQALTRAQIWADVPDGMKRCSRCGQVKSRDEFRNHRASKDGLRVACKPCHSAGSAPSSEARRIFRTYGLTKSEYDAFFVAHRSQCAACGKTTDLCIDHDHKTGRLRGVLCRTCNITIGTAKESIEVLEALIEYLRTRA